MPIEVGMLCDGKVTKITAFGAFVALTLPDAGTSPSGNLSGMIHISEVAASFVKDIHDFLSEGQDVRVKVLKIDEQGRISLSLKQAQEAVRTPVKPPPSDFRSARPQSSSFEDMMSRFKASSDDKISDLKQSVVSKRGATGKSRRRYDD